MKRPYDKGGGRKKPLRIRLTDAEREYLDARAKEYEGLGTSTWARCVLLARQKCSVPRSSSELQTLIELVEDKEVRRTLLDRLGHCSVLGFWEAYIDRRTPEVVKQFLEDRILFLRRSSSDNLYAIKQKPKKVGAETDPDEMAPLFAEFKDADG